MARVKLAMVLVFGLALWAAAQKSSSAPPGPEAWQKEFDDICSKTQDAMTFSVEQLQALVKRCDGLDPQIQKLDDTKKKVYSRRLAQCRGLFAYVLESKQKDKP